MAIAQVLEPEELKALFDGYPGGKRDALIPLLQDVQDKQGYLSGEAMTEIAGYLGLPASKVYGVATFYNQFRFSPLGRFHIMVCRGTACHVKGSAAVLETLQQELSIGPGESTRDGLFSLEVVACVGACGLAPVISVNNEVYGRVTPAQVRRILNDYRNREKDNADGDDNE
ncbi:MAG TPA: NADH-quinone oxidoreductase subunit NuoE [Candidatus Hydrogenedentes bacterium]|nr:NADH-quinone oxidoreductase subunit NuoE [Candidatus Hydrogenedentota bacterium]HPG68602.1 NADH-quinone oxidoreductase subunit NuoE [Candidatus Hydrogenedentota bacterium]